MYKNDTFTKNYEFLVKSLSFAPCLKLRRSYESYKNATKMCRIGDRIKISI
jgi:hypothetical protein